MSDYDPQRLSLDVKNLVPQASGLGQRSFCSIRRSRRRSLQSHGSSDRLGIDRDLLQLGLYLCRNVVLVTAGEVRSEELLHRRDHGKIVNRPSEAVAFVRRHQVLDGPRGTSEP